MSDIQSMTKEYLQNLGFFQTTNIPTVLQNMTACIYGNVPFKLKLSISLSELITLSSQFRKNIQLTDGTKVPINAITFALAGSGVKKDSSLNMVRGSLSSIYTTLEEYRVELAKFRAQEAAVAAGKTKNSWAEFYQKPKSIHAGLGTVEGLMHHFAELEAGEIGAASINSSEIGTELVSNSNMTDIIKTIAIGYDLGKIPAKIIRSSEFQLEPIKNLPINALLFGSQDAILFDNTVKQKFKTIFNTQLARRSIFYFNSEGNVVENFKSVDELIAYKAKNKMLAQKAADEISKTVSKLADNIDSIPDNIPLSEAASKAFDVYESYNSAVADTLTSLYPMTKLARRHKQWLTLKISGALAVFNCTQEITLAQYVQASNVVELFAEDLNMFEKELQKESYELFVKYAHSIAEEHKAFISLHNLRKLGYIPTTGQMTTKAKELISLASSFDDDAVYTLTEEGVNVDILDKLESNVVRVSYEVYELPEETTDTEAKEHIKSNPDRHYAYDEAPFSALSELLSVYSSYSNYEFKDGEHSRDTLIDGTNWVILDIDDSAISYKEAHILLEDYVHHIVKTSNNENENKFRVVLQFDSILKMESTQYPRFVQFIGKHLGLTPDKVSQSHMYIGYKNREVLSTLEGRQLSIKELLTEFDAIPTKPAQVTTKAKKEALQSPFNTFKYAFEAKDGQGSTSMVKAALHAKDLEADLEYTLQLMHDINDYWEAPMDEPRFEKTILEYIRRKYE